MPLSTHYYVLSLSAKTSTLSEAFRDCLVDVENEGFPMKAAASASAKIDRGQLQEHVRSVDRCFGHYYALDPLKLVVVGDEEMQSAFTSVTGHGSAVVGRVEGDHSTTAARDLGQIVWPVVKEAMSGVLDAAMRDLEAAEQQGQVACGLEAVARSVSGGGCGTLLVEDDYHQRGSIRGTSRSPVISPDVDVRDAIDDAVDVVVEKVLQSGGNVVFTPSGPLRDRGRIVFLRRGADEGGSA